ncbi:MAG: ComF family protein, partial [Flavobacterium sp.]|nr:ComF family protein [Flavobacterium sp.]
MKSNIVLDYLNDFVSLIYPQICLGCGSTLFKNEDIICITCLHDLPYTNYHHYSENPVAKSFWGKVPIEAATAFLFFKKGTRVQTLLHQLKYRNQSSVGLKLGKIYGNILLEAEPYNKIQGIVPVPLHPHKLKKRGYNQSEVFAKGISEASGLPVYLNLQRNKFTETQTRKSRFERFENVDQVFIIENPQEIANKHLLLVD